jgi:pimeloyl-ACP methyl ester carboxylesterase
MKPRITLPRPTSPAAPARRRGRAVTAALFATGLLAGCAWAVRRQARRVEAANPPHGRILTVDGVPLHLVERGDADAPVVVMLHGNGASARELELSGLVARAAVRFRVLAFDRPGYGHSGRPSGHRYGADDQARLVLRALDALGVEHAIVLGHSWGTLPAISMALLAPQRVRSLVLVSGYYRPSARIDAAWLSLPAVPLVGTLARHTVLPLIDRLLWPGLMRLMFAPREVAEPFRSDYPVWMSLRPRTLLAGGVESALMVPTAARLARRLAQLKPPVVIVAGAGDRIVNPHWHAEWLHDQLPGSALRLVPDTGHMVHHIATQEVANAIVQADKMAHAAWGAKQLRDWSHQAAAGLQNGGAEGLAAPA